MAESLLLPVVRGVVGKAAGALVQSVTRMCGVDGDRHKLERQLLAVQCKLSDAEAKSETSPAVKRWMKDLKAVTYEADDVLDDFHYEALRRDAQIGDSTTDKVLGYFTPHSPLLFRVAMSKKLNSVLKKINELVEEMNKFGLVERADQATVHVIHPQTHSGLDSLMEIVGRDDDKEMVVNLLLEQRSRRMVEVLPIVGMGGLGKTTLAKMVYNDTRVQPHFELPMWLCVSDDFNVVSLVRSIIELATRENCTLPDRIELLRSRLHEVVGRKRYLLVLDDVWNEEEHKWEEMRPLLHSAGAPGSVVLVTTRSQRVASIMGTVPAHTLSYLNHDDSWELFRKKAFSKEEEEQQPEFAEIGNRIVKKCKGLPLALKTMGGLMSSKKRIQEWEAIAGSKSWEDVGTTNEILSILKLSYRHLPLEMKQCFAFCAIFPKDYQMERDKLVQLWIANNFIQEEGMMDLEERGQFVFNELAWRSFFQDVKVESFHVGIKQTYKSITCYMHDLMHDLAKSVTEECVDAQDLNQQKASMKDVRHLMSSAKLQENSELFKHVGPLHTLLSPYWSKSSPLPRNIKRLNLTSLRALHNDKLNVSPKALASITHLRYLDISHSSELENLPDSVCMLYSLQTLRLNGCEKLQHLPEGVRFMSKLRHLYLVGCHSLKGMPPRIGQLKNLRTLTTFVVDTKDGCGLEELKDLHHLGGRLELFNLKAIQSGSNAREANLHIQENVTELLLHWCHDIFEHSGRDFDIDVVNNKKEILEFSLPPSRLETLRVWGSGHIEMSSWMKKPQIFLCLKELHMSECWRCKDLPPLWQSVSLESLSLSCLDNLTTLSSGIDMAVPGCNGCLEIFPKLKKINLHYLPNLEKWMDNEVTSVMFPELKELKIYNCPKLVNIPKAPILRELDIFQCRIALNSLSHLTSLTQLNYVGDCGVSMDLVIPIRSWPSLVTLELTSLWNLLLPEEQQTTMPPLESIRKLSIRYSSCFFSPNSSNWPFGFWDCFAFVEELSIASCDDLVHWPVKELRSLNSLRYVKINDCKNLTSSSSEEFLFLSGLETLYIGFCSNLLEIPKLPASLETLCINGCTSLVSLPLNLARLEKLRELRLFYCSSLRNLPDVMDGLTGLQELCVRQCPGVETLPQSLLQRLPNLRKLMTLGSHKLDKRCRRGGEYWEYVSNIPCLNIDFIEERQNKGFAKRFLPCCSALN
uniref:Uncharacterized protein n=1 Tax=Oryza barthii TaxID=65489 RepID=A0A0D3H2S3_9ORYZ